MIKDLKKVVLVGLLVGLFAANGFASDIEIKNAEGVTISYDLIHDQKELEVVRNKSYSGDIIIPEKVTINGMVFPVTSIGDKAFRDCKVISMIIPSTVMYIGEWAFSGTDIISITIPEGLRSLSYSIFNGCNKLTSVTIPNKITKIGGKAFYRCKSLTSVTIGENVSSIGEFAFAECNSLSSVTIPAAVTEMGQGVFYETDLTTVVSLISTPFAINGGESYDDGGSCGVFTLNTLNKATLYVPMGL